MYERAAVFLDLQGTLGGEGLGDIKHFTFFPSAIPAIKLLNDANLLAIVVTNQSHIAKGRRNSGFRTNGSIEERIVRRWCSIRCGLLLST